MFVALVFLLFSMDVTHSSSQTPFQLANCTTENALSLTYTLNSPNSKVCAPISTRWIVQLPPNGGAAVFNASLSNVLCVLGQSAVFFNGSVGFSSSRVSLTFCRVGDGACVQMNLFAYPGIYSLNNTVIAGGGSNNQPLWSTFGIKNPYFYVCDSVQRAPINLTAFDVAVDCIYDDFYPVRNVQLQSPLSLSPGTYTIVLSNGSCEGEGVKSDPLTLIVTSSVILTPSLSWTTASIVSSSTAAVTTYVAMTTSATPSNAFNYPTGDTLPTAVWAGVGAGAVVVVIIIIFSVVVALVLCRHPATHPGINSSGNQVELSLEGTEPDQRQKRADHLETHILQTDGAATNEAETSTEKIIVFAEEETQLYIGLAQNLAGCHNCKFHFLPWKKLSSTSDFSSTAYRKLVSEYYEQVYVVWKGPLEHMQSSDFHSFVCDMETRPGKQKSALVQMGASETTVKNYGHVTRITLRMSDGADASVYAKQIYSILYNQNDRGGENEILKTLQLNTSILQSIQQNVISNGESIRSMDKKINTVSADTEQIVDTMQTLTLNGTDNPISR